MGLGEEIPAILYTSHHCAELTPSPPTAEVVLAVSTEQVYASSRLGEARAVAWGRRGSYRFDRSSDIGPGDGGWIEHEPIGAEACGVRRSG